MEIKELAKIVRVPVITSGTFPYSNQEDRPPVMMTEEELDASIESSNLLQPLLLEAIDLGYYRGNENIKLDKPIPPLVNAAHQRLFPQTLNAALKDSRVTFSKEMIKGQPWMVANCDGIPEDIAKTFQKECPWRSVELINLTDPDTGVYHKNVVRSTAFLHKSTRPAVGGQSQDIVVECAGPEDPLITIITHTTPHTEEGVDIMAENTQTVDVAELQKEQAASAERIAELEAEKAQRDAEKKEQELKELALKKAEQEAKMEAQEVKELALKQKRQIAELQAAQERSEVAAIEKEWMQPRVFGNRSFTLAPAAREVFMARVAGNGVAELAEGEDPRKKYVESMNSIIEMAGNGTLLVQTSLEGVAPNTNPRKDKPKTVTDRVKELRGPDPQNPLMSEDEAYIQAVDEGCEDLQEVA
jgi:hypothetical protein